MHVSHSPTGGLFPPLPFRVPNTLRKETVDIRQRAVAGDEETETFTIGRYPLGVAVSRRAVLWRLDGERLDGEAARSTQIQGPLSAPFSRGIGRKRRIKCLAKPKATPAKKTNFCHRRDAGDFRRI